MTAVIAIPVARHALHAIRGPRLKAACNTPPWPGTRTGAVAVTIYEGDAVLT